MSAGSIHDMILKLRYNKSLLRKKNSLKEGKKIQLQSKSAAPTKTNSDVYPKASRELLDAFAKNARKSRKKFRLIKCGITLMIVGGIVYLLSFQLKGWVPKMNYQDVPKNENKVPSKTESYIHFLNAGDEWMGENKWHNAAFEYKKALEFYPGDYDATYRLTVAYVYHCHNGDEQCDLVLPLIDKLLAAKPESTAPYLLRAAYYMQTGDTKKAELDYQHVDEL